jgi:hypothetical protein
MYPEALGALLTSPLFVALAVIVASISTWICKFPLARGLSSIAPLGIVKGYVVVLLVASLIGAVIDVNAWDGSHASVAFLSYAAVITLAVFVVPGIALLAAARRDTIPWAIFLGLLISVAITVIPGAPWRNSGQHFALICGFITALTFVFGIAAGLRWNAVQTP